MWTTAGEKIMSQLPHLTTEELAAAVAIAKNGGRFVTVHSSTVEGMLRSIKAGVHSIEHGDQGTEEIFKLMKEKGIALCPTLSASAAIFQYYGWKKGITPEPEKITVKRQSFQAALEIRGYHLYGWRCRRFCSW